MSNEPLGLPRGSIRAILTLMLVVISAVMLFIPAVDGGAREMFLLLTGIAVRDYFAHREKRNTEDGPPLAKPFVNGEE